MNVKKLKRKKKNRHKDIVQPAYRLKQARQLFKSGEFGNAEVHLRKILQFEPKDQQALSLMAETLQIQGKNEEAVAFYRRLLQISPETSKIHCNIGNALSLLSKFDEAGESYQNALRIDPNDLASIYGLAVLYERINRVNDALHLLEQGLQIAPDEFSLNYLLAACEARKGNYKKAISILGKIELKKMNPVWQKKILFELGKSFDRTGQYQKAYEKFLSANNISKQLNKPYYNKNNFLDKVEEQILFFSNYSQHYEKDNQKFDLPAPIFIVGFPRSGTTLLNKVLNAHPMIKTLEEENILWGTISKFIPDGKSYDTIWEDFTNSQLIKARQGYFKKVHDKYSLKQNEILIDKHPFHIINLGFIWKIFPDAKIIFTLRHPLDVCLSCFIQDFVFSDSNASFFSLKESAHLYSLMIKLWQNIINTLPIDYYMLKYEKLITDLQGETSKLLTYLDIDWDDSILEYASKTKELGYIGTASYSQVVSPIYQDSKYRWKNYEDQLKEIKHLLNPYLTYFNY